MMSPLDEIVISLGMIEAVTSVVTICSQHIDSGMIDYLVVMLIDREADEREDSNTDSKPIYLIRKHTHTLMHIHTHVDRHISTWTRKLYDNYISL